jgi:hypothetical protein
MERYHIVQIAGEEVRLRIRVQDLLPLHKALGGAPLMQILQRLIMWDVEVIVTLLQYARRHELPKHAQANAVDLLAAWMEDAELEVIAEELSAMLAASGIIKRPELPKEPAGGASEEESEAPKEDLEAGKA